MAPPVFRYHPDPLGSGSLVASDKTCRSCGQARGYIYTGPVYSAHQLDDSLCPWCIADGSAHEKFDAIFVDDEAFEGEVPEEAAEEITERTPGFNSFQGEGWPGCCEDATAFVTPAGMRELREQPDLEGLVLDHIIHQMEISGGAATRLLNSLHRDAGPTAYLFRCLHCQNHHFHIDYV
ncbi:MAG: hypothetical protein JWP63_1274 [Candidatus Solibacter sp.]|jgi:uncharacterized protein CbrC (UPF0167 family)|nr:hypothetical protein [Candidatus Solibacter sp.]